MTIIVILLQIKFKKSGDENNDVLYILYIMYVYILFITYYKCKIYK